MPKRKEIHDSVRNQIIAFSSCGESLRSIASRFKISHSAVSYIINKWKQTGSTSNLGRAGRPGKICARGKRQLKSIVKKNRMSHLRRLTELFNEGKSDGVSSKTVARNLHKLGYWARRPCRKPLVSTRNKKKRLAYFHLHKHWQIHNWKNIIFTDESKFNFLTSDGRIRVWRCKGERYLPGCTIKTLSNFGGSLMFWGCITYNGVGPLLEVPCNVNSKTYISHVLEPMYRRFWKKLLKKNPHAVFMQDNAPYHRAHSVTAWFGGKRVNLLDWPPQSPDLNPIENVWAILSRKVRNREPPPATLGALREALLQEWRRIPLGSLRGLYEGLPRRIKAIQKSSGNPTKY